MRIVAVTEHYPATFKTYFDTQFADLLSRGHDVRVLAGGRFDTALSAKVLQWRLQERTTYYPLTLRTLGRTAGTAARAMATGGWFRMPRTRPLKRDLVVRSCLAALEATHPDLVLIHGVHAGLPFAHARSVLPEVPIALYYHGGELPHMPPLADERAAVVFRGVDHVFTNTRFSARHAIDRGCPPERITLMPVGFDLDSFPDPGRRHPGSTLSLLSAGRMSEEKGFHHALEALGILRDRGMEDFHYTLTGGANPYRARLEALVDRLGLGDRVTFAGTVTTEALTGLMGASDILLLPSLHIGNWAENQAAAVQEALLMRCLAVTTTTGGVPESIPPGMHDFQVPPADPEALADAIQRASALPPERWEAYTDEGRTFVAENYDIRRLNDLMLEVVQRK